MEILPTSPQTSTSETPLPSSDSTSILTSDFEVFLQMLTAQAEYQDPLEPIDSTEYAAQLAQFSMVEQQVATNSILEKLIASMGGSQIAGLSGWIGMEALSNSPVNFEGFPVTIAAKPPVAADEMVLLVKDAQGRELQRQVMSPTTDQIAWAGVDASGTPFENGTYKLEFEYRGNGNVLSTESAQTYNRVTEARLKDGEVYVVLDGGILLKSEDIQGIREPL